MESEDEDEVAVYSNSGEVFDQMYLQDIQVLQDKLESLVEGLPIYEYGDTSELLWFLKCESTAMQTLHREHCVWESECNYYQRVMKDVRPIVHELGIIGPLNNMIYFSNMYLNKLLQSDEFRKIRFSKETDTVYIYLRNSLKRKLDKTFDKKKSICIV